MFEVSAAKKQILEKLTEQPWTPTDLAEDLDKSRNTVYNHLDDLHEQGVLTKTKVAAKTRPKTEYSIGSGFVRYLAVLPGEFTERSHQLTPEKQTVLRIWSIPQERFQPYIENYWWRLKTSADLDYRADVTAVAVYGSVARGEADDDSDIDFLVLTEDEDTEAILTDRVGSTRIEAKGDSKICMTETYTVTEYRDSRARGSGFLDRLQDELHVIYDPENVLRNPEKVPNDEQ